MILITGRGFIGGAISDALGPDALTVSRSGEGANGVAFDLTNSRESGKLALQLRAMNVSSIIHTAAVTPWSSNPNFYDDIEMAKNIVSLCEDLCIENVFFISGWNVYDMSGEPPFDENTKLNPVDDYGKSKLSVENYLAGHLSDTNLINLRLASVYGPGQVSSGLIPNLVEAAMSGRRMVLKSLTTRRDYIYIKDVVSAVVKLIAQDHVDRTTINLGGGRSYAVYEVAKTIQQALEHLYGELVAIEESSSSTEGFPSDNLMSIDVAKKRGLLENTKPFEEGIHEYIEWKKHANLL